MTKIKIKANGKDYSIDDEQTIGGFIEATGTNPRRCVVEYNSKPLRYADFAQIVLCDGDVLEIMEIVAGG